MHTSVRIRVRAQELCDRRTSELQEAKEVYTILSKEVERLRGEVAQLSGELRGTKELLSSTQAELAAALAVQPKASRGAHHA